MPLAWMLRSPRGISRVLCRVAALLWLVLSTACDPRTSAAVVPPATESSSSSASGAVVRVPSAPLSGPDSARVRARIDSVFARFDRPGSPGCVVTVMRAGEIVFARGYGSADIERGTPLTTASPFDAASMAKQFLAFGVALLAGEGKLSLNDPVQKHLPELPDYGAPVTLRHLIHHTSGLRDWEARWLSGREDVDPALLPGLSFPPGEDFVYDDTGYDLLQRVLERVAGKPWPEFARERIWNPLGMASTGRPEIHRIPAYRPSADGGFQLGMTPHGEGFTTTPEDLARWDRNFYEPRVGGPELIQLVLSEGRLNSGEAIPYAFGLHTEPYRGLRRVWHGGLNRGYRSQFMRFPDQRLSVLTMCNVFQYAEPNALTERVVDIVLENEIRAAEARTGTRPERSEAPLPTSALEPLVGLYLNRPEQKFRAVRLMDGRLEGRYWITWHPLRSLGAGRFRVEGQPLTAVFESPGAGDHLQLSEISDGRRAPSVYQRTPEAPLSAAEMAEYTGTFRSDELGATWHITAREGELRVQGGPEDLEPFSPAGRDAFLSDEYVLLLFERAAAGPIVGFTAATPRTRNLGFTRLGP